MQNGVLVDGERRCNAPTKAKAKEKANKIAVKEIRRPTDPSGWITIQAVDSRGNVVREILSDGWNVYTQRHKEA